MIFDPVEIREKFGPLFSQWLLTMVDQKKNVAEIVETCSVQGTLEWDAVNRCRAGGALIHCDVTGKTMVMRAKLGESSISFDGTYTKQGGQGLEGIVVKDGCRVQSMWAGIGRAAIGIVACLAQSPGVTSVRYPHKDDMKISHKRINRVEITTPLYEKVTIGIDDTDDGESGSTWELALKAGRIASELDGVRLLGLKLVQLYPGNPHKTTNGLSCALMFAARADLTETLIHGIAETIRWKTRSRNTGIAVYRGIGIPQHLVDFGWEAKKRLVTLDEARAFGREVSFMLTDAGEERIGLIGALAAVALSEEKTAAAAFHDDKAMELFRK